MRFIDRTQALVEMSKAPQRKRRTRLTESQRLLVRDRAILELSGAVWSLADLSAAFGLTERSIRQILQSIREIGGSA